MQNNSYLEKHLFTAKHLVYDKCGFEFNTLKIEDESQEYGACSFKLNDFKINFRISKITPTKAGQFVTIWKRNSKGKTEPFNLTDEFDFVIISTNRGDDFGQFIFPKSILLDKGIITGYNKKGKCGIRVYPPWDIVTNKQAEKTQLWQSKYFLAINKSDKTNLKLAKQLLETNSKID